MINYKKAQSAIEYGLILGVLLVAAIFISQKLGNTISNTGTQMNSSIPTTMNGMSSYCKDIGKTYNSSNGKCQ